MSGKNFLRISLMAILIAVFIPAHAKVIKIATISPDGALWMKEMRAGAEEIKKRTQGRVIIKFYPNKYDPSVKTINVR